MCSVLEQFRGVSFVCRVRQRCLLPPFPPLYGAACPQGRQRQHRRRYHANSNADLPTLAQPFKPLPHTLFRRLRQRLLAGRIAGNGRDTLPRARPIPVPIFLPAAEIRHPRRSHRHRVGPLGVIDLPARPRHRVVVVARIPRRPDAQPHLTRRLRVRSPAVRILVLQRPDQGAVDVPLQFLLRPCGCVVVEPVLRAAAAAAAAGAVTVVVVVVGHGIPLGARNGIGGIALAIVIVLHVRGVAADDLPVDLVEVVGLEHDGRDDPGPARRLHPHLHDPEEEVEFRLDGRGVALLVDREGRPRRCRVVDRPRREVPSAARLGGREVERVVGGEGGVGRAGAVEWVAGCPGLGEGEGDGEGEEGMDEEGAKGRRHRGGEIGSREGMDAPSDAGKRMDA